MEIIFKRKCFIISCLIILLVLFPLSNVSAQSVTDSTAQCPIKSIGDVFKKKDSILVLKPMKNNFFLIIPIIGSQPATGFVYGAVAQYTFKGKKISDKYSTINLSATYTAKKQLLVNFKNNMLLKENSIFFSGDWRYYYFSQSNYGLGTDIVPPARRDKDFSLESLEQLMEYNYFKFHQTVSWRAKENFYVGAGIHLDGYSNINDVLLDVPNNNYTYHYSYSKEYGFDDKEYYINGVSFNLVFDSRDNQINTNNGWFGNINYRINPSLNNNQNTSSVLFAEYRYFKPLSTKNSQHVLGVWAYGQFVVSGSLPYLNLPAIGWDQRSRSGKGYTQGLFRGYNLVYFETEYRFPITCNQLVSGTVFADFTTASDLDRNIRLFQYIQPAAGVGLRILIDKATRTNLIANYAWGRHSDAFYLNAGETF